MKRIYRDRLLKLAKHLESGRPGGHKRFKFSIFTEGELQPNGKCGTAGCAIGECPTVFPRQWKLVEDKIYKGEYRIMYGRLLDMQGARKFFGLDVDASRTLFTPEALFDHVTPPPGTKRLGAEATAKQVAKNIRGFLEAQR